MTGEDIAFFATIGPSLVAVCALFVWGVIRHRKEVREQRRHDAWNRASEALLGDGSDHWIGDEDRDQYERRLADRAWLQAQRSLCESTPAKHSSWWQK